MKLLLHACCGPCSLEPVRLLHAAGHELALAYMNSNIHPQSEYTHRLDTLLAWAHAESIPVIEGVYSPRSWEAQAGCFGAAASTREDRCRACYRLRLEEVARYAAEHDFDGIGSTLSVSPYQYTTIIEEELARAAERSGLVSVFEDFRPFYEEATRKSHELGMYRQNYCGCHYSAAEAARQREERALERRVRKQEERAAHADEIAVAEKLRAAKKAERQRFAEKQAAKRAIKDRLRHEASQNREA
ncbi:MAG: epoxyqueuosine reductase QueH [Raoultibacter sp.]